MFSKETDASGRIDELEIALKRRSWSVVAASVCGSSHERIGLPCQDATAWQELPRGVLVAAVADGAGTAAKAQEGARTAVKNAVSAVSSTVPIPGSEDDSEWKRFLESALKVVKHAIEVEANEAGLDAVDFATTLIFMVATEKLVGVAQIGDGAAVAREPNGELFALTTPTRGEYANETVFLTSPDAMQNAQLVVRKGAVSHLAAFSDGLQNLALKMPEGTPHSGFFGPLFSFAADAVDGKKAEEDLIAFLRSKRVRDRTDDDLTLLVAARVQTVQASVPTEGPEDEPTAGEK